MSSVAVRVLRVLLIAAAAAIAAGSTARASLMIPLELNELVKRSDHIAVVDVVSVTSAWDAKHERILSTIQLNVVEAWKGPAAPAARITVVQPGGTVDDITMVVFGLAQFKPGERTLLFLRGRMGAAAVVGMAQGRRPLTRDALTGKWMAEGPDRSGVAFTHPPGASSAAAIESTMRRRTLDEMREEIRGIVKAAR